MSNKPVNRGVSKSEWFEAALDALSKGDIHSLTVEGLASQLGIGKSGFYWHFKNKDELLQQLLDYWVGEVSSIYSRAEDEKGVDPRLRLLEVTRKLLGYRLEKYETAIQQWALHDPRVALEVRKVNRQRLNFFRQTLEELGISGPDAEMRAHLYVCSVSGQPQLPTGRLQMNSRKFIESRINFLTSTD